LLQAHLAFWGKVAQKGDKLGCSRFINEKLIKNRFMVSQTRRISESGTNDALEMAVAELVLR